MIVLDKRTALKKYINTDCEDLELKVYEKSDAGDLKVYEGNKDTLYIDSYFNLVVNTS